MMASRNLPYPGQLISLKFTGNKFVREVDSDAGYGACELEALVNEPLLVMWVEYGVSTLGTVHVMHPSGWTGWRAWSDGVAASVRIL